MVATGWESMLDVSDLEQRRQRILQILNTGSLKDLKGLQQIGDKKAKLILGWREIHGHFAKVGFFTQFSFCAAAAPSVTTALILLFVSQLEDLVKVEGMTEKRFSSFAKASIVFSSISTVLHLLIFRNKMYMWGVFFLINYTLYIISLHNFLLVSQCPFTCLLI